MNNSRGVYAWAFDSDDVHDDVSVELRSSVICTMPQPDVINKRGQWKFPQDALNSAKEKALKQPHIKTVFLK